MTHEQKKSRQKKASLLEVKQTDPFTFLVQSQSDPEMFHKVTLNGHTACSCLDWRRNHEDDPAWACKHIAAALDLKAQVERVEAQQADQVNGSGLSQKERIELEAAAMFGDQAAIDTLNAAYRAVKAQTSAPPALQAASGAQLQTAVALGDPHASLELTRREEESRAQATANAEALKASPGPDPGQAAQASAPHVLKTPATAEETPQEAQSSEPLDPCMECGALLPAAEMLPHQSAEGSGLICVPCNQDLQAQEEAQKLQVLQVAAGIPEASRVPTLAERIDQVNELLSSFGPIAIEADQKGFVGYGAQYVLDAVNGALGSDGWKYDLVSHSLEKVGDKGTRALVMIQLHLRQDNGSWFCHGPQFGGGQSSDPADALKSALTDALKKALSHWGIGSKAYRGELKASRSGKAA